MFNNEKPKYQALKEYLIDTIKSEKLKPGDQIETEIELAEKFGVSRHTIRQAIGELVAEGWLYRVQGKGTFVDRRPDIAAINCKTIGVMTTYLNEYIFSAIIRGIDRILSSKGYNIILSCTYNRHEKEKMCMHNMLNQRIDGLIVESTRSALPNPNLQLYKELSARGVPILFIHGCYKDLNYSYIVEDDMLGGYLAAKHLIELGHKKIGGIFKVDDIQGHYRFEGFQKACSEYGISLSDSNVLWFDTFDLDFKFEAYSGNTIKNIVRNTTGIVCYNDQIAVKVLDAIRGMGLSVPEDVSIVSFDDSDLATASEPKLTTLAHPKEQLGVRAAESIIQMIERKVNYFGEKIEPKLIVRNSTAKRES
ncbi:MAG TPA: GntR family transcriptional regulator [Clostridiaceae bacterium]|nr:GntR family transcriptional regulator [Clostridiaceae bacterium]